MEHLTHIEQTLQTKDNLMAYDVEALLKARDAGEIDFTLVDVREPYEYSEASIKGCDYLLPTSQIQGQGTTYEKLKSKNIVLYCRTGNRTSQVMMMLKQAGITKVSHLAGGIVSYQGEVLRGAAIPRP